MKIKNIILLSTLHHYDEFSYDALAYNIYIALKIMGYNVNIFNPFTSQITLSEFENQIGTPDLLFCILTGLEQDGLLEYIRGCTQQNRYITFNLFCDDAWRFEEFSSKICKNFTACSTSEPEMLDKYRKIGYPNIRVYPFPVCEELYNIEKNVKRHINVSTFSRWQSSERERIKAMLRNLPSPAVFKNNVSFEEMVITFNRSKIVLNSCQSSKSNKQMKMRIFEAVASGALLMTEQYEPINKYFIENKEYVSYSNLDECGSKLAWLLNNPQKANNIAHLGYERWRGESEGKLVLGRAIKWLEDI